MALFRKFFYRKPPDGLLEITERVYVFDSCFSTDVFDDETYQDYIGDIASHLRSHFADAFFMAFNFRQGEAQSQLSTILSSYDMVVMDYPRHYEGCPLLTMEMIHHFLRSGDSWLALGQSNVLLLHCERGGWAVLAFMLAGLLLYRKIFVEEQRTLEMIYRQAPRELIQLLSPLNPMPSQIRYLHYISRRNVSAEWPPGDHQLTLDCVILRNIPGFNGEAGCRPIFRIYGQDPKQLGTSNTPKLLFSTPKRSKYARLYKQADCELIKVDIHCHVHGDVVLECISLDADQKREEMMFRVMFNTAFIRSNILMLNRDEVDILWDAKDRFPREFRAEVLLSEMDTADQSDTMEEAGLGEKEGLPVEAFSKVQEMFSTTDWIDHKGDAAGQLYQPLATTENINLGAGVVSPGKLDLKERWPFEPASISPTSKESDNAPNKSSSAEQSAVNKQERDGVKKSDPLDPATISQGKSGSSVVHEIAWDVTALMEEDAVSEDSKSCGSTIISPNVSNFASAMVKTPPKPSSGQHAATGSSVVTKSTPPPQPSATAMEASDTRMISDAIDLFQPSSTHSDLSSLPNTSPSHEQSTLPGTSSLAISHQQSSKIIAKERLPISPARHPPPLPTPPISPILLPTSSSAGIHCPQPDFLLATTSTLSRPTSPPPITPKFAPIRSASLPVPLLPPPPSAPISRPPSSAPKHPPSTSPTPPPSVASTCPISPTTPPPTPPLTSTSSPIGLATQSPPSQHPYTSSPVLTATLLSSTSFFVTSAPLVPPSTGTTSTSTPSPPPPPPPCQSSHLPSSPANKSLPSAPAPPPPHAPNFSKNERGGCQEDSGNIVPPPQSGLLSKRLQSGQATSKRSNLKPLHWVKVTRAMQGSLWAEGLKTDEASKDPMFDLSELENLFSAALPNPRSDKSGGRTPGTKVEKIHLIDLRRANNCGIMLTKVKMPRPDLMNAILALDDTVLDADQVDNLIKFTPTKEEIELLKGYKGDKQALGECEQFFLELMKVPRVESKLRVFSFKIQFRSQVSDLKRNLNIVNSSAEEIRGSVKLKRIMQTILSLGNALNQGTARGSAVGFRLDSLLKLSDTRARNSKMTLMHYLSKVLFEKLPELLDFPKDLASLDLAAKIQLKSLAEEMQAINKGLEKVEQELITSENDGPVSEIFRKTLKDFLSGAEAEVRALTSLYSIVGRNADALALYFGEDPARCPFEEVVTTLRNFVRLFVRSHEENCKLLELEKRKAQKEAETSYLEKRKAQKEAESLNVVKKKAQKEAQTLDLAKKKAQKEAETLDLENKIAQKEAESLDLLKRKAQKEAEALDLEYKIAQKEAESLDLVKKKAQKEAETLDLIKKKAQKEAETLGLENKKAQKEAETMDLVKRKTQKEAETLDLENKRAQMEAERRRIRGN